ncbi:hypothetical protein ACX80E_08525 [Arthrobacter sp. TMN-49]
MFKKLGTVIVVGLLAVLLAACGGGKTGNDSSAAENLKSAIAAVPDVVEVKARYNVNAGMGSTVNVRIMAQAGVQSLETVLRESLQAFAGAADGIKDSSSVSFQVTEVGQENTINPTAVGLAQSPSVAQIIEYASGAQ